MKIDLKNYMENRDQLVNLSREPGPVVCISRSFGCHATPIVNQLITQINHAVEHNENSKHWRYVSKEILEEGAHLLGIDPKKVEQKVEANPGSLNDVFSSLSHHYNLSNKLVVQTVREVVEAYIREGNVIVVGRGGSSLTQQVPNALHIRLDAPIGWRADQVSLRRGMSETDAIELIEKMDHKRILWAEHLSDLTFDESLFDLILNRKTLSDLEIVDIIFNMMKGRKMI
ncbi:MAG: cytidylate kinase-like family protein [Cyclobacteriaceae bacterium]